MPDVNRQHLKFQTETLPDSRLAWLVFHLYATFGLTPVTSWKESHNYHHGHVGEINRISAVVFPLITTKMWHEASRVERARYHLERHPLVMLFGYITIFAFSICILPLLRSPSKHLDSLVSIVVHVGLIAVPFDLCMVDIKRRA